MYVFMYLCMFVFIYWYTVYINIYIYSILYNTLPIESWTNPTTIPFWLCEARLIFAFQADVSSTSRLLEIVGTPYPWRSLREEHHLRIFHGQRLEIHWWSFRMGGSWQEFITEVMANQWENGAFNRKIPIFWRFLGKSPNFPWWIYKRASALFHQTPEMVFSSWDPSDHGFA